MKAEFFALQLEIVEYPILYPIEFYYLNTFHRFEGKYLKMMDLHTDHYFSQIRNRQLLLCLRILICIIKHKIKLILNNERLRKYLHQMIVLNLLCSQFTLLLCSCCKSRSLYKFSIGSTICICLITISLISLLNGSLSSPLLNGGW